MDRRQLIKATGASLLLMGTPLRSIANTPSNKKIVWVVLRGALDSLHTIVPRSDKALNKLRPTLYGAIKDKLLPINDSFGLHPSLAALHQMYQDRELIPIVAVGTGYKGRSHFDGQDFLEAGLGRVDTDDGWLARAIEAKETRAVGISRTTPVALRGGSSNTLNWFPSNLKGDNSSLYDGMMNLYQYDESLTAQLEMGLDIRDKTSTGKRSRGNFVELSKACGSLLKDDPTISAAMLELGGWDTHNRQDQRLKTQLSSLDEGIATLRKTLGRAWDDTTVIITTEFGRTAAENGTKGTDHGTASMMFIAGGSINGGNMMGEWPGLENHQLFEARDLMPTSNVFDWQATVLKQHWNLSADVIAEIFPGAQIRSDRLI